MFLVQSRKVEAETVVATTTALAAMVVMEATAVMEAMVDLEVVRAVALAADRVLDMVATVAMVATQTRYKV